MQYIKNTIINEDVVKTVDEFKAEFSTLKNKRILITGANGMLPSYLVYSFVVANKMFNLGNSIYLLTRRNKHRINLISEVENEVIYLDSSLTFGKIPDFQYNYIIHAASDASPTKYLEDKIGTMEANVKGLYSLLGLDLNSLESFLFYSTAELYGNPPPEFIPTPETYLASLNHLSDRSCYVESKKFCETICRNYFFERNYPIKIIRPFHVFGPGVDLGDGRVFSDFLNNIIASQDIVIKSDGLATRSFCYLNDALAMTLKVLFSGNNGSVYNIGNPENEISMKDLANLLIQLSDTPINVKILGGSSGTAPLRSCPDISAGRKELGFKPTYHVLESFRRTLYSLKTN